MNHAQKSYIKQKKHLDSFAATQDNHAKTWLKDNTVDAWRHRRQFNLLSPLIKNYPKATWLTVGDGKYGRDAHFIEQQGRQVVATDISDALLKRAYQQGFIKNYQRENAEALSFKDQSFDFVLCKESYHHFPRPSVAVYEMLRVAKKAVILIEPQDTGPMLPSVKTLIQFFRNLADGRLHWPDTFVNRFEKSGNYVYHLSQREVEKLALGLNLPAVAFFEFDDVYLEGVEYQKDSPHSPLRWRIQFELTLLDWFYRLGLRRRKSLLAAIIFKQPPSLALKNRLSRIGFSINQLPPNPYL